MAEEQATIIPQLLAENEQTLLRDWMESQKKSGALRGGQISEAELAEASRRLIAALRGGAASGQFVDITAPGWDQSRTVLEDVSRSHATLGLTPSETATFVFSLKEPLFALLRERVGKDPDRLAHEIWIATMLLDKLGLYSVETFQKSREDIIRRQQEELLELSTPVVRLWEGVLALPLIGTLDSARTQTVMESLLRGDRHVGRRDRHHRHHRGADGRHLGGAASDQDRGGRPLDGGRLHHQRHPAADRANHCPSRARPWSSFRRRRWPTLLLWRSDGSKKRSSTEGPLRQEI